MQAKIKGIIACIFLLVGVVFADAKKEDKLMIYKSKWTNTTASKPVVKPLDLGINNIKFKDNGFWMDVSFLYWKAQNEGWRIGFIGPQDNEDKVETPDKLIVQDFDIDPGARVKLAFLASLWDIAVKWTYLKSSDHHRESASGDQMITSTFSSLEVRQLKSSYKLKYHLLDGELGRYCRFSKQFLIRPFVGIRGAWIDQDFYASFSDSINKFGNYIEYLNLFGMADLTGVGVRGGIDADVEIGKGFSLYAGASVSGIYSKIKWSRYYMGKRHEDPDPESSVEYWNKYHELRPEADILFGLSWMSNFSHDDYIVKMSLGWEMNYWWDMFPIVATRYVYGFLNKALNVHGLVFDMSFQF